MWVLRNAHCSFIIFPSQVRTLKKVIVHIFTLELRSKDRISSIDGIRSNFCFRASCTDKRLYTRTLSCHCQHCMNSDWNRCRTKETGEWNVHEMQHAPGSELNCGRALRSDRTAISMKRQALAQKCNVGDWVALESNNDADGFSFWLAKVNSVAFKYDGPRKRVDGVLFRKGGRYIEVTIYDRFPVSSKTSFKSTEAPWTIDAEGIIDIDVNLSFPRSFELHDDDGEAAPALTISIEEAKRLDHIAEVRLN